MPVHVGMVARHVAFKQESAGQTGSMCSSEASVGSVFGVNQKLDFCMVLLKPNTGWLLSMPQIPALIGTWSLQLAANCLLPACDATYS